MWTRLTSVQGWDCMTLLVWLGKWFAFLALWQGVWHSTLELPQKEGNVLLMLVIYGNLLKKKNSIY